MEMQKLVLYVLSPIVNKEKSEIERKEKLYFDNYFLITWKAVTQMIMGFSFNFQRNCRIVEIY